MRMTRLGAKSNGKTVSLMSMYKNVHRIDTTNVKCCMWQQQSV